MQPILTGLLLIGGRQESVASTPTPAILSLNESKGLTDSLVIINPLFRFKLRIAEGPQKLEGSWMLELTPIVPPPGPFTAYCTFANGGAFIGSASDNELSFVSNPQHGVWEHRGGDRFASSFKQVLLDDDGKFAGVLTADALLTTTAKTRLTASRKQCYTTPTAI